MTPDAGVPASSAPAHAHQTATRQVTRVSDGQAVARTDHLAGEEPLLIRLAGPGQTPVDVATTMRTPGHEVDLAVGLLHAEGLLMPGDVVDVTFASPAVAARPDDEVTVHVRRPVDPDAIVARHAPATASCGICGRASIEELLGRCTRLPPAPPVAVDVLATLPDRLRAQQGVFDRTGGLHAAGIATREGQLRTVREDIGRHNALDAAIGHHVRRDELPLTGHVAVLSGRIGFELVQKAAVAGLGIVVAVGAPSDLAVRTAEALDLALVGFVRGGSANVYTAEHRIAV